MHSTILPLMALLLAFGRVCFAEESKDSGIGLFDFSQLDVPKEEEKKARDKAEKGEMLAEATLPDEVRRMLDRLTTYEVVVHEISTRRTVTLRKSLKDKLLALSEKGLAAEKADCVALAKIVEELSPEEPLTPESVKLFSGTAEGERWNVKGKEWNEFLPNGRIEKKWTDGTWHWINRQRTIFLVDYDNGGYSDAVILPSPAAKEAKAFNHNGEPKRLSRDAPSRAFSTVKKPGSEALRLLSETSKQEAGLHDTASQDIVARRRGVAQWLLGKAKTATPAASAIILARARELEAAPAPALLDGNSVLAGVWQLDDGKKLEFKPDGSVIMNGQADKAAWQWAKARSRGKALLLWGKPGEATDAWFVRRSTKEPGVLRFTSYDRKFSGRLPQATTQ